MGDTSHDEKSTKRRRVHDYVNEIDADKKNVSVCFGLWAGCFFFGGSFWDVQCEIRETFTRKKKEVKRSRRR